MPKKSYAKKKPDWLNNQPIKDVVNQVINELNLVYFEKDIYYLKDVGHDGMLWCNTTEGSASLTNKTIMTLIVHAFENVVGKELQTSKQTSFTNRVHGEVVVNHKKTLDDINDKDIVFKNGYICGDVVDGIVEDDQFCEFEDNDIPFTPYQLPFEYNPDIFEECEEEPTIVRLLNEMQPEEHQRELMLKVLSTALVPKNFAVLPVLYSKLAGVGKGTLVEMLIGVISDARVSHAKASKLFGSKSNFGAANIDKKTLCFLEEMPSDYNADAANTIKQYANDSRKVHIEKKGMDAGSTHNCQTYIGTTNEVFKFKSTDDSIRERVIWIPLEHKPDLPSKMISEMLSSKTEKQYFAKMLVDAYMEIITSDESRNKVFFTTENNEDWTANNVIWQEEDKSDNIDFVLENDTSRTLATLFETKSTFIPNNILASCGAICYQTPAIPETARRFKKELVSYLKSIGVSIINTNFNKQNVKGIKIEWPEVVA